jgi:hypothetical protein
MIDIPITLDAWGEGKNVSNIGRVRIGNVGRSVSGGYAYVYLIESYPSPFDRKGTFIHGVIRNHERSLPVTALLQAVMEDNGKGICDTSEEYAKHWSEKE